MNNQIPGGSELDKCVQRMKPILFNTEMVRAILDGRKTVTRRVVKVRYRDDEAGFQVITNKYTGAFVRIEKVDENECGIFSDGTERYVNPPYDVGDILWVRETWNRYKKRVGKASTCHIEEFYGYKASPACSEVYDEKWRPSIHMPREAARIFLRVVDVRAERLQDISDGDCEKEGFYDCSSTANGFACAWDNMIKPADRQQYSWDASPWVWVIEFEKCEKPREGTR